MQRVVSPKPPLGSGVSTCRPDEAGPVKKPRRTEEQDRRLRCPSPMPVENRYELLHGAGEDSDMGLGAGTTGIDGGHRREGTQEIIPSP
jgi:hypothetical protein